MTPSTNTMRAGRIASALGLAALLTLAAAGPGGATGSVVLPASAMPHGYSLQTMASVAAPFTRSGNDPTQYPNTPFQILYVTDYDVALVGSGVVATGTNEFTVAAGTSFYVPVFNVNDAPPVLGVFPTTEADARSYFFDQPQYGGRDFEVIVDGVSTELGRNYLVGPLPVAGEATHIITLAAFVAPLSAGTHTVRIRGGIYGDLVDDTYGVSFIREDFTYTVVVV